MTASFIVHEHGTGISWRYDWPNSSRFDCVSMDNYVSIEYVALNRVNAPATESPVTASKRKKNIHKLQNER